MSETHLVAEPPTDEAFYRAEAQALNRLAQWLYEERQKVEPSTERWRTLADVTTEMYRVRQDEVHPAVGAVDPSDGRTGNPTPRE